MTAAAALLLAMSLAVPTPKDAKGSRSGRRRQSDRARLTRMLFVKADADGKVRIPVQQHGNGMAVQIQFAAPGAPGAPRRAYARTGHSAGRCNVPRVEGSERRGRDDDVRNEGQYRGGDEAFPRPAASSWRPADAQGDPRRNGCGCFAATASWSSRRPISPSCSSAV